LGLFNTFGQEMGGVHFSFSLSPFRDIRLFMIAFAGDAMVFDSGIDAGAIENVRPDIIDIEIVPDVAIELPVIGVAGISLSCIPYLARTLRVTPKCCNSGGAINRCMDAIARPLVRTCHAVRFKHGKADAFLVEKSIQSWKVSALGKPETIRRLSENLAIMVHA